MFATLAIFKKYNGNFWRAFLVWGKLWTYFVKIMYARYWAKFHCCKWPKLNTLTINLVTLVRRSNGHNFLLKLFKYFQAWLTQFWQTFPPSMAFTLQYFPSSFTAFSALRNMFQWVSTDNANLEGRLIVKLVSSLTVLELTKQENTLLYVCTETAES